MLYLYREKLILQNKDLFNVYHKRAIFTFQNVYPKLVTEVS